MRTHSSSPSLRAVTVSMLHDTDSPAACMRVVIARGTRLVGPSYCSPDKLSHARSVQFTCHLLPHLFTSHLSHTPVHCAAPEIWDSGGRVKKRGGDMIGENGGRHELTFEAEWQARSWT